VSALFVLGADPALAVADEKAVRAALEKVDFLVVQDSFITDTASYADVVLPAAVAAEDEGTFTNGERVVQRVRAAVPARGESLPDWKIVQMVANVLGADWAYGGPADVMREIADVAPSYKGVSYEKLEAEGLHWPCSGVDSAGTPLLHTEQFAQGKAVLSAVAEAVAETAKDAGFPLKLVTGTARAHHGTGVRSRRSSGLTKLMADAWLELSADDAARAGVADGQMARVTSQTGGSVEVVARVTSRVPEGVAFLPGFSAAAPVSRLLAGAGSPAAAVKVEPVS
jgi:predicted molibdopterin-dependent oxidoreductase YjgC